MKMWINLPDVVNVDGLTVHEVKCPKCGLKETFHTTPSLRCAVCESMLAYIPNSPTCGECKAYDPENGICKGLHAFYPVNPDGTACGGYIKEE